MNSASAKNKHWCGLWVSEVSPIYKPAKMPISSKETYCFQGKHKIMSTVKSSPPVHSGAEFVEWNENFVLHMQMEAASPKQRQKDILLLQETSQKMHKTEDLNNVWVNKLPVVNDFLSTTGDISFPILWHSCAFKIMFFPQYFSSKKDILT